MKRVLLVLSFLLGAHAHAQEPTYSEWGLPLIRHYSPTDYDASEQNWNFAQHPDGSLIVANDDGILIFNGSQWRKIAVPGSGVSRSVAVAPDGTIWVGLQGDMGYLAPNDRGELEFVSILDELPEDVARFADVWGTEVTDEGIFFQTYPMLIRRNDHGITIWKADPESHFFPLLRTENALYVSNSGPGGRGILKVEGDSLIQMIAPDDEASSRTARLIIPQDEGSVMFLDQQHLFHVLESDGYTHRIPSILDAFLQERAALGGRMLPSKHIAVWTYGGGVALMDQSGALVDILDDESGLPSSLSYTAYPDQEGGLWLGQDIGITRVEPFSGITTYHSANGLIGNVRAIERHNGQIYAATDRGLFRLVQAAANGLSRATFESVGNLILESWGLLNTDDSLLLLASDGLFEWHNESLRLVVEGGFFRIHQSSAEPDLYYLAGRTGITSIRKNSRTWETPVLLDPLEGHLIVSMDEDENGDLWMGTRAGNILRFPVRTLPGSDVEVYGTEHGIELGFSSVLPIDDRMLFLTSGGVRRFDPEQNFFLPDSLFGADMAHGEPFLYYATEWRDGMALVLNNGPSVSLAYADKTPDGTFRIAEENGLSRIGPGGISGMKVEGDVMWVATTTNLFRYAYHEQLEPTFATLAARIENVYLNRDSLMYGGYGPSDLSLDPGSSSLRFVYSAPTFHTPEPIRFRVRLAGLERNWSAWTTETQKDYTNLSAGSYTFEVEAEDPLGRPIAPVQYAFVIEPFWYETLPARAFFLLTLLGLGGVLALRGPDVARRVWARLPHKQVVSHYRLEELVGSGGAGQVWRARNLSARPGDPREVAVKLLHVRIDPEDSQGHQRLRREADLLSSFEHPNIVHIYEAGVWKNTPFVAMDLLQGETLRHRIQEHGPLAVTDALSIFTQLGDALRAVHEASVIHRDIKTDNVMLVDGEEMKPVLMDFGLARGTHLTTLTQLGQLLGTLGYVSPEQAMGHDADVRSDIFSFGVVMYETLTGKLPFEADNEIGMLHAIFNQEPPAPSALVPDIPEWLDTLVMECLSKEPSGRPEAMHVIIDRLLMHES